MGRRGVIREIEAPRPEDLPATPEAFLRWLGGPTLLRVRGRDPSRRRAVTTLLHGNEPSGLRALHAFLRKGGVPAVDALFFVASVEAALAPPGFAHRQLPGRPDLNRCFLPPRAGPEGELAAEALRLLREARPEYLIDVHNNTGHNPPYGVSPVVDEVHLRLVGLFGSRFIHSDIRLGGLVEATNAHFPSVVVEVGRAGDPLADQTALRGLETALALDRIDGAPAREIQILESPVRVRVAPGVALAFGAQPSAGADLTVAPDVDRHNFELLAPGVRIGWVGAPERWPVEARGADGVDVSRELFAVRDGVLETRRPLVPIMMTTHVEIARSDCLFYAVLPAASERRQ
jgi:hypothetical protein